ncbi:hypothetical protein C4D60_Mb01t11720 [Musa balbisiana]|uniref:Uncharacterized protein n=1 Tax=Musa balbisiana TaxID=52838 RepID=A0A4S8JMD6_MUSBA|nr:hypothetical protein C4D60_Mb01t11720 [Musa balbisiana]
MGPAVVGPGSSFLGPGFATRTVRNKGLVQPMESRAKPVQPHWHNKDVPKKWKGEKKEKKAHRNLIEHIVVQMGTKQKLKKTTRSDRSKQQRLQTECPVLTWLMR